MLTGIAEKLTLVPCACEASFPFSAVHSMRIKNMVEIVEYA